MASTASAVSGSLFGAAGALIQGQAQAGALDRAAAIERQNASLDMQTGQANADISAIRSNKHIGAISAGYGAAGIAQDSGSALAVLAASASNAELDRQNIMHGAKVRAINYENQATMDEYGAKSALQGSYFNALSSIMMGGSKVYGQQSGSEPKYEPSKYGEASDSIQPEPGMEAGANYTPGEYEFGSAGEAEADAELFN